MPCGVLCCAAPTSRPPIQTHTHTRTHTHSLTHSVRAEGADTERPGCAHGGVCRYGLDDSDDEEDEGAPRTMEAVQEEEAEAAAAAVLPSKSQARYGLSDSDDDNVSRDDSHHPTDSRMRHVDTAAQGGGGGGGGGGWTPSFARGQQSSPAHALPAMLGLDPSSMQVRRRSSSSPAYA